MRRKGGRLLPEEVNSKVFEVRDFCFGFVGGPFQFKVVFGERGDTSRL